MNQKKKIFFGFEIESSFKEEFAKYFQAIEASIKESTIRWVPSNNYHITFCYLGWVDEYTVDPLCERLKTFNHTCFELQPVGYTWMGQHSPRALTLEFSNATIAPFVHEFNEHFRKEGHFVKHASFRPHVTFVRHKGRVSKSKHVDLSHMVESLEVPDVKLQISELILFESVMTDGQVSYVPIQKKALG